MIGFDEATTEAILAHPIADPLARASAWMNLWQAVRYGRLSPARYIDAVAHHGSEPDSSLLSAMTTNAAYAVENFMADRQVAREHWFELCLNAYEAALFDGADDRVYVWRRALVGAGATYPPGAQKLHALLTDIGDDKDQRWQVYISLAAVGKVDQGDLDKELGQTPTEADILAHMQAGAAIPEHRQAAHDRALAEPMSNDRMSALLAGATASFERINYPFFEIIEDVWRERSQEIATRIVHALFPAGDEAIADGKAWLDGDGASAPAALRKIVIDRVDARERDVRVREG